VRPLPPALYWAIYSLLVAWVVLAGLHLTRGSFWVPIFWMFVLDWALTRDAIVVRVLCAFLMLAVLSIMLITIALPDMEDPFVRAPYDVAALLVAMSAYQVVLWRKIVRKS
jgi:hypothetical protein